MNYPELTRQLFHGSTVQVRDIDLSMGANKKDFGKGFYTTTSRIQAERFVFIKAKRYNSKKGFVSVFEYTHNPKVLIKNFDKANIEWLSFILEKRGFLGIKKEMPDAAERFDIVIGPVANDAVGVVLNQLLIGTYGDPGSQEARDTAIRLLETSKLHNQVFLGTELAVSCLKYREAYEIGID
jgi:hypothetical protein